MYFKGIMYNSVNITMLKHIHNETQYLYLVRKVIQDGLRRTGRNGNTISYFGHQMRFDLRNNTIPFITTKKLAWKTCLKELLWFIKGDTSNKTLKEQNVKIWNGNGSREFLDSRGLQHYEEDDLGPVYGFQWNNFNGTYRSHNDYDKNGIDQLTYIINALNNTDTNSKEENRYSRRLIVSAWNPSQINDMALPPCHVLFQFYVNSNDELSCSLYQRSGDVGLGIPFNIASYSFLTHLIAHHTGLKVGEFIHTIGDCHIYDDHREPLSKQLSRKMYEPPKVFIDAKHENLKDYTMGDFRIEGYKYHDKVSMEMRV